MSDYTPAEIEAAVEDEPGWSELSWQNDGHKETITLRGEPVEVEIVASDPGGEGHGEDVWIVVKAGDQLFMKTGYYASHYGTDWDGDVTEVKPAQKTITVYEAV